MRRAAAKPFAPVLKLSDAERQSLRRAKIRLRDLDHFSAPALQERTNISPLRAEELISLCRFQRLSSVGPASAEDLYKLGYRSLQDLQQASPVAMYNAFCHMVGHQVDPCVEDVFRCAVAQARDPELSLEKKNWWYWTDYRGQ